MLHFFKSLLITLVLVQSTLAISVSDINPTDYVSDYTNTLTTEQVLELSQKLGEIERTRNIPIAVVMVNTIEDNNREEYIERFAVKLYEKLGIGDAKKDEGLLWIIVKDKKEMRMEVGYGLEPVLTDGVTKNIQDNFVRPEFKNGDYYLGIKKGLEKVGEVLNGEIVENKFQNNINNSDWMGAFFFVFVLLVNVLGWLFAIIARTKSWWLGGIFSFVLALPLFYFTLGLGVLTFVLIGFFTILGFLLDYLVSKNYKYWQGKLIVNGDNHGPDWWAGGTWGPGSGSWTGRGGSGFGGFGGGGMSGGGGSNSSW